MSYIEQANSQTESTIEVSRDWEGVREASVQGDEKVFKMDGNTFINLTTTQ